MTRRDRTPDERFESAVVDLLADRGRTTNGDVRAALDGIGHLPARSGGSRSWLAAAAAVAILVLGGAFAFGRISVPGIGTGTDRVGRAAFADDPRLAACEAQNGTAAQVFEMTHAEWFPLHFPGWYRGAPELEVRDPALVVIGPTVNLPAAGGAAGASAGAGRIQHPWFQLCIAVGTGSDAQLHQYGPTWFDRIVPVLSDDDVRRAAHLDPDVLADPAAWSYPERLAACGGLTGDEQFIFEARLSDLRLYFPHWTGTPFTEDDPVVAVVYRSTSADAARHDVCLASEIEGARPDHVTLRDVDLTGFRVRIDRERSDPPILAPGATPLPSDGEVTPQPLPPWAADASQAIDCVGPPSAIGPTRPHAIDPPAADAASTIEAYLRFVRSAHVAFPVDGFVEAERATGAQLWRYNSERRTRAALVVTTDDATDSGVWQVTSVASCDPSEYDPATPLGIAIHIWTDVDGKPLRTDEVYDRPDCSGARALSIRGRLFLGGPIGDTIQEQLEGTYEAGVQLPKDALWLGYLDGSKAMWTAVDGKAVYIVPGNDTANAERLPHVIGDEIQRTDCG